MKRLGLSLLIVAATVLIVFVAGFVFLRLHAIPALILAALLGLVIAVWPERRTA